VEYVGGMIRLGAAIIDGVIVSIIFCVLLYLILSHMLHIYWLLLGIFWLLRDIFWLPPLLLLLYHWLFTGLRGQTPGKMAVSIKVVNAQGDRPSLGIAALREVLGKLISTVVLCLGFLWIDWDKQKRGWHDTIASTHVVKVVKVKSTE